MLITLDKIFGKVTKGGGGGGGGGGASLMENSQFFCAGVILKVLISYCLTKRGTHQVFSQRHIYSICSIFEVIQPCNLFEL